jgi:hypothetical protein
MIDIDDDSLFAPPPARAPERRVSQLSEAASTLSHCAKSQRNTLKRFNLRKEVEFGFLLFSAWISDQFPWISFRRPLNLLRPAWNSLFRFELNIQQT